MNFIKLNFGEELILKDDSPNIQFKIPTSVEADRDLGKFLKLNNVDHGNMHRGALGRIHGTNCAHHKTMWYHMLQQLVIDKPIHIGVFSLEDLGFDTSPTSERSPSPRGILKDNPFIQTPNILTVGEVTERAHTFGLQKCPQSLAAGIRLMPTTLISHGTVVIVSDVFMIDDDNSPNNFNFALQDNSGSTLLTTVSAKPSEPIRNQHKNAVLNRMGFVFQIPEKPISAFMDKFGNALAVSSQQQPSLIDYDHTIDLSISQHEHELSMV